jgi:hypothetical protein
MIWYTDRRTDKRKKELISYYGYAWSPFRLLLMDHPGKKSSNPPSKFVGAKAPIFRTELTPENSQFHTGYLRRTLLDTLKNMKYVADISLR